MSVIVIAVWSGAREANSLTKALNTVHEVGESRSAWKRILPQLFFAPGLAVTMVLAIALLLIGPRVVEWLVGLDEVFISVVAEVLLFAIGSLTVLDDVFAVAVVTGNDLSNHSWILSFDLDPLPTYISFTSDNGFEQGEHRIPKGKNRPYEESARVPLYVKGQGVPAGATVEKLAVNTDFAPTFAELAGLEFPADGRSLVPLLHDQEPSWRSAVLLERLGKEGSDEEANDDGGGGKGKAKNKAKGEGKGKAKRGDQSAFEAIRTDTHKYVEYGNGEKELYDLETDPYELDNVYESADSSLAEDLKTRLDALKSCSEAGCREAEDAS